MRRSKVKQCAYIAVVLLSILYILDTTIPPSDQEKIKINFKSSVGYQVIADSGLEEGEKKSDNDGRQVQNIRECECSRTWMYPPNLETSAGEGESVKRLNSTCSDEGTHYQPNQNVISFSMSYSKDFTRGPPHTSPLTYQIGLLKNLLHTRKYYPSYSVRVYTSVRLHPRGYFCDLLCQNNDLFWCDIQNTPSHGDLSLMNFRTWRFLPLGDPTVGVFHSRDLDSLLSNREAAAVQDWLSTEHHKGIMAMRDRKVGHDRAMLAGMWGADNTKVVRPDKLRSRIIMMSKSPRAQDKSFDQHLLRNVIFYPMAKYIVAYDSYNCVKWSNFTEVRPFPVQRGNPTTDFVGNRVNFTGDGRKYVYGAVECPLECRPVHGGDWVYC